MVDTPRFTLQCPSGGQCPTPVECFKFRYPITKLQACPIDYALDARLPELAHAAITALDEITCDADLEPDCDNDDDGRGNAIVGYNGDRAILAPQYSSAELLRIVSFCKCCGAVTGTESVVIA